MRTVPTPDPKGMRMNRALYFVACSLLLWPSQPASAERTVCRMRLEGPIGPMTGEFVGRAVDQAESEEAVCLVIEMDTPGGLDLAMRLIVKRILAAEVPVVVYVSPSGSRSV